MLDCDSDTIVAGVRESESGQLTRLYFEAPGGLTIGAHDKGPEYRRVLDLRATEAIGSASDPNATIIFADKEGTRYIYTKRYHVESPPEVGRELLPDSIEDYVLVRAGEDGRKIVGNHVAFAIPNHRKLSPQLPERPSA